MNNKEFDEFIKIKIQDLVDRIMEKEKLSFENALNFLYKSKTYEVLLDESSKLWHLSTEKLFLILTDEKQNSKVNFPDYV